MSDVVPSFFPTPHEIAGGIRWMREHPVVATAAAAAATAVSVLTYLKSRAVADGLADLAGDDSDSDACAARERLQTWSEGFESSPSASVAAPASVAGAKLQAAEDAYSSTESEVSTTSPTVRRSHPSSSSVSAFAFAGADDDESAQSPTSAPASSALRAAAAAAGARFESVLEEDEEPSASPQWGWYVSTTPPEEYYS